MASILCVDDNAGFLSSMVERLQAEDHYVHGVSGPREAIAAFKKDPFKFDLVITDMKFPDGTGEELVAELISHRETRGYDAGPEIVCLTGTKSMTDSTIAGRVINRGCQYALKGTDQWIIATELALNQLADLRGCGPTFVIIHAASEKYGWDPHGTWRCQVGESVSKISILISGRKEEIKLGDAPRRLLDFFARSATRRAYSLEDTANALSLNEFYNYWDEDMISTDSVKNNVRRIRVGLDALFKDKSIPLKASDILVTEGYEDHSEPSRVDLTGRKRIRTADTTSITPYSSKTEFYRLKGKAIVEHVP